MSHTASLPRWVLSLVIIGALLLLAVASLALTSGTADAMVAEDSTTKAVKDCTPAIGDAETTLAGSADNGPGISRWSCRCQIYAVQVDALGHLVVYCRWAICTTIPIP